MKILLVSFAEKECLVVSNPFNVTIVIMTLITNYQFKRILIDTMRLVNIIFKLVFEKMNLASLKFVSTVRLL